MIRSPHNTTSAPDPLRWILFLLGVFMLVLLPLAHVFDADLVNALDARARGVEGRDTHRLLRVMGSAYFWILVVCVLWADGFARRSDIDLALQSRDRAGIWSRGVFVLLSALGSGLLAELIKVLVRRGRPDAMLDRDPTLPLTDPRTFGYVWNWEHTTWGNLFDISDLGIASSHAATAFGGMIALGVLWPRWRWVLLLLAGFASITRLQSRGHYLSDVIGGAACGAVVVLALVWGTRKR